MYSYNKYEFKNKYNFLDKMFVSTAPIYNCDQTHGLFGGRKGTI